MSSVLTVVFVWLRQSSLVSIAKKKSDERLRGGLISNGMGVCEEDNDCPRKSTMGRENRSCSHGFSHKQQVNS